VFVTCKANSRVGARTIACIFLDPKRFYFRRYSTTGNAKAKVFPEPVKSLAMTSCRLYIG